MLFTVEKDPDNPIINIQLDKEGLAALEHCLQQFKKGEDHCHLMTPSWGGFDLSEAPQNADSIIIHQVNIDFVVTKQD